ncbi:hypothetical protein P8888_18430 [Bacillus haynesii]|nr:hypothetical protein [Bacillus haynesii]
MLILTGSLILGLIILGMFLLEYKLEKRKRVAEKSPHCFHTYQVSDIDTYVDQAFDTEVRYHIACVKCGYSRVVDYYELEALESGGLLIKREESEERYCLKQEELREVMISNWKES